MVLTEDGRVNALWSAIKTLVLSNASPDFVDAWKHAYNRAANDYSISYTAPENMLNKRRLVMHAVLCELVEKSHPHHEAVNHLWERIAKSSDK